MGKKKETEEQGKKRTLNRLHERFKAGDRTAILYAIYICFGLDIPIPAWCQTEFLLAMRDITLFKAGSWDDVFGKPHKKGISIPAHKERAENIMKVWWRVRTLKQENPGWAIDNDLFKAVGKELGIGSSTKVKKFYYQVEDARQNGWDFSKFDL